MTQQETHLQQARASLQQALSWYSSVRRHWNYPPNPELQAAVRPDLQALKASLEKLEQNFIKIATFGLVSRGKSAVINALMGQKMLESGPIHGVTKWPKSVRWTPPSGKIQVEFIDTPGLDEIDGEQRAIMAREIAEQADLILFVISEDITRTEYEALLGLRKTSKPLILVFNKIDLYPEKDCQEIYQQLQKIGQKSQEKSQLLIVPEDIVLIAAAPQPIPILVKYPDGTTAEEWETPAPKIDALRNKILTILNQEGRSLLSLNALRQAEKAEENIARKTVKIRQKEAEEIIWKYVKYKSLAVAINPIAIFDLIGGAITDLGLIRSLAQLYGLPITSYEAGKLWRKILLSSGGLLLGEIGSSVILGLGKSALAASSLFDNPGLLTTYSSTAIMQGGIAGYFTYIIGKAAQEYLEKGCSWGPLGPSMVIKTILNQVDPNTIIYRLQN
ncbi:GTP-binding protein [Crocosphaera sp. UHCC 0190]|uniref:GTP-binding protein n=1 Tax=Crocosphaera sp. UHCC 0190 TaxID=3110246 RepID=UPI002B1FB248|nr:GTP-binding protein [Crocosphaera sp. UHCC 0190]MEA5508982.1 GTP-binding protein [Crocosphaera sp. UHCC 0190]